MSAADENQVDVLRHAYRLRYRDTCMLPATAVIGCWHEAAGMSRVNDTRRQALRLMRRQDTGMD